MSGKRVGSRSSTFAMFNVVILLPFALKLFTPTNSSASTSIGSRNSSLPPMVTSSLGNGVSVSSSNSLLGFSPMML